MVVDTSVLIAVVANEPEKSKLIEMTRGAELIAPHSGHWEIGNAFSAMFKRNLITLEQAHQSLALYQNIQFAFVEIELEESLNLAQQLNIYSYTEAIQKIAFLFEEAFNMGEVKIRRDDGKMLVIRPEPQPTSPLDVEGIDLGMTTGEIIECIHEGRRTPQTTDAVLYPEQAAGHRGGGDGGIYKD